MQRRQWMCRRARSPARTTAFATIRTERGQPCPRVPRLGTPRSKAIQPNPTKTGSIRVNPTKSNHVNSGPKASERRSPGQSEVRPLLVAYSWLNFVPSSWFIFRVNSRNSRPYPPLCLCCSNNPPSSQLAPSPSNRIRVKQG